MVLNRLRPDGAVRASLPARGGKAIRTQVSAQQNPPSTVGEDRVPS